MPLLQEIGDYLTSQGVGTLGTNMFLGYLPDAPNTAGAIYPTGGITAVHAFAPGPGQAKAQRPSVQIVWRSTSFQTADTKIRQIWALLDGLPERTLGGTRYQSIEAVADPALMNRDEQGRTIMVANFYIAKDVS